MVWFLSRKPVNLTGIQKRNISKYLDKDITGKAIRKRFLDFFINENNHTFIRSSPVVPFYDETVAFVNAGMCQFKSVFLGAQIPRYKQVANCQKCIRVGGKHNDLNIVGTDGYHHTFFEMLGNWSFGDYFKKEACFLAWKLLTEGYNINKSRLYVTYFGGDKHLNLDPDIECRDIWRTIGVHPDRIIPFGYTENFWEMGPVGPCGPCTEIHIDHIGTTNRATFLNKGLHDLTELWNIVFIEYSRNVDGSINPLSQKHIDTGMGLERLTAILQRKLSNYDTDIFTGIIDGIHKNCKNIPKYSGKFGETDWNKLDTSYRILADHSRMVTACLADGMIPEENQKLRRVIRRTFGLSETLFQRNKGLLKELSNYVVESLGSTYPEMEKNIKQVQQIIDYEEDVYRDLRTKATIEWQDLIKDNKMLSQLDITEMPGLLGAIKEIKNTNVKEISADLSFKLYDTFGIDEETITKIASCLGLRFNTNDFKDGMEKAKIRSQKQSFLSEGILVDLLKNLPKTIDKYKYNYKREGNLYDFESIYVKIIKIIQDKRITILLKPFTECYLLLDKTNLYSEAGGQISDKGKIIFDNGIFDVVDVVNINGRILHKGFFSNTTGAQLVEESKGVLYVNEEIRLENMRNHTATHILNEILKNKKGVTCQKSSKVTPEYLNFTAGIFGQKLSSKEIEAVEEEMKKIINSGVEVKIKENDLQTVLNYDKITMVPGEVYPDDSIRVIEIKHENFLSREPCCGTHLLNTSDLLDFCIVGNKSVGRSTTSIYAVTGKRAMLARENGRKLLEELQELKVKIEKNLDNAGLLDSIIAKLKIKLKFDLEGDAIIPYVAKNYCSEELDKLTRKIKDVSGNNLKELIEMEMKDVLNNGVNKTKNNKKYLVHYLRSSLVMESVPLQKATKLCSDIPVLIISYSDNTVKARCCVPENMKTDDFNAQKWIQEVSKVFDSPSAPPKGTDPKLVSQMKAKKISVQDWDTLLEDGIKAAKSFAEDHL